MLNAVSIVVWRLILGGSLLFLILRPSKTEYKTYLKLGGYLGVVLLLHFIFFVKSVQDTFVMNATVIVNSAPIITLVASWLFRTEKIDWVDFLIVYTGFLGILIMAWGSIRISGNIIGDLEAFLAALMISIYALSARKLVRRGYDPYRLAGPIYLLAGLLGLIITVPVGVFQLPQSWNDSLFIILLALIPTAGGHTLFLRALKGLAPHEAQILALLEPVVASILALIILQETPPLTSVIGSILVIISILLLSIRSMKAK
ncbi:MAG: DMT family transporter [Candidatus Njordarchaeales archaeon]